MRLNYIDGLKGLGAFIVFLCHFNGMFKMIKVPFCLSFFTNGELAVTLFLVLSGFSVSLSLDRNQTVEKLQSVILGRFFRFSLPIAIVAALVYIIYICGAFSNYEVSLQTGSLYGTAFQNIRPSNYLLTLFYSPMGYNVLNPPLWMIKYIFMGTFAIIILFVACYKMNLKRKAIILLFFMLILAKVYLYYVAIVSGMLLFFIYKECTMRRMKIPSFFSLLLVSGSYLIGCFFRRRGYEVPLFDSMMLLVGSNFLLGGVISSLKFQRILSVFPFDFLGEVSFEIFLFHFVVISSLSCKLWLHYHCVNPWGDLLVFVVTIVVTLLLSLIMKRYITPKVCHPVEKIVVEKVLEKES